MVFIVEAHPYNEEILVFVGVPSKKEILAGFRRNNVSVAFTKWALENRDKWHESIQNKNKGLFHWDNELRACVLILRPLVIDDWDYWETVLHETHHLIHWISQKKMMAEEMEAQAYLFEYVFRKIRRTIHGFEKPVWK